ncbi:ferric uptake regulation protein [Clostridium pasteurianum DSM 525 = ATCC 6013]|uniref:Ferric uptake regulation protein n=1 Tax=Clostridium pasteurianum DSM 525 = ATCC 6013 TaxID=1262449 RepID=A0A0H3JA35_CLOPA|nr:Fur family transcriptional regulator [Clostridium pasteurianum]AJA48215.1 ferric uptake regulation protein [Clostridium pasteurianum DSM 525 = ATCC 6013]AJA52203.1 ferric uptake regulation protein [Clostridium pasteurianum DSM 525 = ATCC 6013]AOZ75473.1 Fur family transcriptional regulator [Clostridium pasteurianum DSM 525 = ATCC 6013]AOZ79268.1 Fur family transcriptional regulator [Clostridium pasteurianum]ELP60633.1 Ferric uptake regulation protein [Clostridium pasteurianum DSM 525 = ATCC
MPKLSIDEIEKLKNNLKEKGYKLTPQRRAVLDTIIKSEGQHLTAEEIYELVKVDCPEIGLATVYRTVLLLEELNVVCKLDLNDGCSRYELIHENENHQHHHLICINCGKVIEVEGDLLESLENTIEEKYVFKIKNHSVKFYGLCSDCNKSSKLK